MPLHLTYNTTSRVFSVCGKCLSVYTRDGVKVKSTFYKDIETAQKAFIGIIASYEA